MPQKIADEVVKINLTLPKTIHNKLLKEKEDFSYLTIQTIILEALRDRYFQKQATGRNKGRPKNLNLLRVASAKRVFK